MRTLTCIQSVLHRARSTLSRIKIWFAINARAHLYCKKTKIKYINVYITRARCVCLTNTHTQLSHIKNVLTRANNSLTYMVHLYTCTQVSQFSLNKKNYDALLTQSMISASYKYSSIVKDLSVWCVPCRWLDCICHSLFFFSERTAQTGEGETQRGHIHRRARLHACR